MTLPEMLRDEKFKSILFIRSNFTFLIVYSKFDVPKCKFITKNSTECVATNFFSEQKSNF